MLKVANIIEEARLGGPQVRVANVACSIKDEVTTTVIMPCDNSKNFVDKLDSCKVRYKLFPLTRVTKELKVAVKYIVFTLFEIISLVKYFRIKKFDLIHVSGGSWQYKGILAGKISNTKLVWHLNDTSMPWVFRKIFSLLSTMPDAYIFASERTRDYYSGLIKNYKMEFVIPAPVDTEWFSPNVMVDGDKELIQLWENKTVIGMVANLSPIKGIDIFIQVAVELNKEFSDFQFVVIGAKSESQSSLHDKLIGMLKDLNVTNIKFVGRRNDLRPLLKRIDIYVCSSYAESSPISVWEAMSMAKPIVSADVGDVGKYVLSGESGEVVPVADVIAMKDAIIRLFRAPQRMKYFGMRAREIAIENLDIKLCADRHIAAYKKILDY